MSIALKKCRHLWVTNLQQGAILGHVGGAVLDKKTNQLLGFIIKPKTGPDSKTEKWLPVEHVKKVGTDMLLIANATKLLPQAPSSGLPWERLRHMPVSSKDGRALGHLQDLTVDEKTWVIKSLELDGQKSVVLDPEETVLGEDLILIQAQAQVKVKAAAKIKVVPASGLSGSTRRMARKGEKLAEKTTQTLRKVLKGTEANLARVRERLAETNPNNIADLSKKTKTKKKSAGSKA